MVRLYTKRDKSMPFLSDCEASFRTRVVASEFDDIDCMILEKVDSAKLLDKGIGTVQTPFGVTSIESLSTGCKAVLLYRYFVKHSEPVMLSVIECGTNALNVLFSLPQSDTVKLYLAGRSDLYRCTPREYLIDDTRRVERLGIL